jgi:hypothetical protein
MAHFLSPIQSTQHTSREAPGRPMRALRFARGRPSPSRAEPEGPKAQGSGRKARMGQADGLTPTQDPGRMPKVPHRHPRRSALKARPRSGSKTPESRMKRKFHVRFGGGPSEKYPQNRVTRRRPTLRVGSDEVVCASGDLQGGPGGASGAEHRGVGAGEASPDPRGRLAQVGIQRRQGDLEALRSAVVLVARPQEMGPDRS